MAPDGSWTGNLTEALNAHYNRITDPVNRTFSQYIAI